MTGPRGGVIHDIGYQRYDGVRHGRGYARRSLYLHSLRAAYGLGRTAKAKIFPWGVLGVMVLVAVVIAAVRAGVPVPVMSYLEFPDTMSPLTVLFCAVVAPELVSRDLRSGVLPLYFSRPLRRSDYALAKLAALVTAVWLLLAVPLTVMFAGAALNADGIGGVWDELTDFAPGLLYAAVQAALFGALSLLLASFVGRRAVAAGLIVALFLVPTPVVGTLYEIGGSTAQQLAFVLSPITLPIGVQQWWFGETGLNIGAYGPIYGLTALVVTVVAIGLLLVRYRKVAQ